MLYLSGIFGDQKRNPSAGGWKMEKVTARTPYFLIEKSLKFVRRHTGPDPVSTSLSRRLRLGPQ
jgi:hypothetical protein